MIIKEWSNEELGKDGYTSFKDKILSKFYGADISREKQYRWAMAHKSYFAIDNEQLINNVNGGHGELFGYPIAIDNSIEGLIFEEHHHANSLSILSANKDDVIVIKSDMALSLAQITNIKRQVKDSLKHSNKVLVLSHGLDIGVIRDDTDSKS